MIGWPYNNRGSTSAPSSALARGLTSDGTDTPCGGDAHPRIRACLKSSRHALAYSRAQTSGISLWRCYLWQKKRVWLLAGAAGEGA